MSSRLSFILFALFCRVIASFTYSHWFHPDEWCQTLEPANFILHGFGFHSQEIGLHLRNLSWPLLLTVPMGLAHSINPNSIELRFFLVNLLCGLLDLLIFWGWVQLIKKYIPAWEKWGVALLLLPWFTLYASVNPRAEHLSEIAFWVALGCFARQFWMACGCASIAIFAFRYPSGLLSLGIGIGILLETIKEKNWKILARFALGVGVGAVIYGLADTLFYGRPWESLWMYLQYNVFTGSSTRVFGQQGIAAYGEFFTWYWGTYPFLLPFAGLLFVGACVGFYRGLRSLHPWAICLAVYILGHLLVPHKEGRFILPIETVLRWSALLGIVYLGTAFRFSKPLQRGFRFLIWASIILNGFIFLHALRADFWKARGTYRELGEHQAATPHLCAILSNYEPTSLTLPFQDKDHFPQPAFGLLGTQQEGVLWIEKKAQCQTGDQILVHRLKPFQTDTAWMATGCHLLPSGILRIIPRDLWDRALEKKLVAGPWYQCSAEVLQKLADFGMRSTYSKNGFGRIPTLPRLGIPAEELEAIGYHTAPPPRDAGMPSLLHPVFRVSP